MAPMRRAGRLPRTRVTAKGVARFETSRLPARSSTSTVTPAGTAMLALSRSVTSVTPALVVTRGATPESISIAGRSVPAILRFPDARRMRIDSTPSMVEIAMAYTLHRSNYLLTVLCAGFVKCGECFVGGEFAVLQIGQD